MKRTNRKLALIGMIAVLVLTAGCMDVTMEVTVDEEGALDLEAEMILDSFLASMMEEEAEGEGIDAIAEDFAQDLEDDGWNVVDYDAEELDDGDVRIWVLAEDTDADDIETISVSVEDDQVTYLETDGFEDGFGDDFGDDEFIDDDELDEFFDSIQFVYILNMPGEITDTNGEQIDDSTVQWSMQDHMGVSEFEATSDIDDDAASPIPGFSLAIGILALLSVTFAYLRLRDH